MQLPERIKLPCPISRSYIQNPVFYSGYIYDASSLCDKISTGELGEDERSKFYPDQFTIGLLELANTHSSIPVSEYDNLIGGNETPVLDLLYKCPVTLAFPRCPVVNLQDGYTYDKSIMVRMISLKQASPTNRGQLSIQNIIIHPLCALLIEKLRRARNENKIEVEISDMFNDHEQSEIKKIDLEDFLTIDLSPYITDKNVLIYFSPIMFLIFFFLIGNLFILFPVFIFLMTGYGLFWILKHGNLSNIFLTRHNTRALTGFISIVCACLLTTIKTSPLVLLINIPASLLYFELLLLFFRASFFDRNAKFNINCSPKIIFYRAYFSIFLALLLSSFFSYFCFVAANIIFPGSIMPIYIAIAASALCFNGVYKLIYNFRCANFIPIINKNSKKENLIPLIIYKATVLVFVILAMLSIYSIIGLGSLIVLTAGLMIYFSVQPEFETNLRVKNTIENVYLSHLKNFKKLSSSRINPSNIHAESHVPSREISMTSSSSALFRSSTTNNGSLNDLLAYPLLSECLTTPRPVS